MKKALGVIAALVIGSSAVLAQSIYYQGRDLSYSGNERPYNARGTVMVPARRTAEMIGATFDRDSYGDQIRLSWHNNRVTYSQGSSSFDLNGRRYNIDTRSEARSDVLYVPVDLFEALTNGDIRTNAGNGWGAGGVGRRGDDRYGNGRWDNRDDRYGKDNGSWRQQPGYNPNDPNRRYDPYNNNNRNGVTFDGRSITFDYEEQPYIKSGVLMVPFRAMGDKIGARTDRTEDGRRVWIYFGGDKIEYDKGHTWFRINGQERSLKAVSEDRGRVLFVPVTLFEEATRGRVRAGAYY